MMIALITNKFLVTAIATHPQNQTAIAQITCRFLGFAIATHPQNQTAIAPIASLISPEFDRFKRDWLEFGRKQD